MLSSLRAQATTIPPVPGCRHISLARASHVAAPASGQRTVHSHHRSSKRRTQIFVTSPNAAARAVQQPGSTVPESVGRGLRGGRGNRESRPRLGLLNPGCRKSEAHARSSAPRPRVDTSESARAQVPRGWSVNLAWSCLRQALGSQFCPPGPKDRPWGTLEEKYGVSGLECSLETIKPNPCIHREKLRLRESEWFPRAQLVKGRARCPETLSLPPSDCRQPPSRGPREARVKRLPSPGPKQHRRA